MIPTSPGQTGKRKDHHLTICLEEDVEYYDSKLSGFGGLRFDHDSLPEVDKDKIDLSVKVFGKTLQAPLIIGAMTGGTDRAKEINHRLAKAAARFGIGFALGSQRILLEKKELAETFDVRKSAPQLPLLFGNLGAVQLNYGVNAHQINELISAVNADVFNLHLNPLQEAIQPEGDVNFSSLIPKIREILPALKAPVVLKEVGSGLSQTTAEKIKDLAIAGVETAGTGGTSWSKIETFRTDNKIKVSVGNLFASWGTSTVESIRNAKKILPHLTVVASGGLRNGIEVAKSLSLGAHVAAMALPFLKAAEQSEDHLNEAIEGILEELRIVLFLTGSQNIEQLRNKPLRSATDLTAL